MFRLGQKVVCVDDSPGPVARMHYQLELNAVYTIRGFCENIHGEIGLLLEEVWPDAPPLMSGQERGFRQSRFRPAIERKTDISIFTKMLTDESVSS